VNTPALQVNTPVVLLEIIAFNCVNAYKLGKLIKKKLKKLPIKFESRQHIGFLKI
jgi:hypothetical protein